MSIPDRQRRWGSVGIWNRAGSDACGWCRAGRGSARGVNPVLSANHTIPAAAAAIGEKAMSPRLLRLFAPVALSFVLAACGQSADNDSSPQPSEPATAAPPPADLSTLLANPSRAAEDRTRDTGRNPAGVIEFLGIEHGMTVIDVIAAGGYYTEVLSLAVGPDGRVMAHNPAVILEMRDGVNEKAISARLAGDRLANVSRLDKELADISAADGPFDAGITALNFHDIYNNYGEEATVDAMTVIYNALKPGGVFGIIDHQGTDANDNAALHRVEKAAVIRVAEAAGFEIDGDSGLLHMHEDDMSLGVFDESVRGKTHRFLLKLRRPAG